MNDLQDSDASPHADILQEAHKDFVSMGFRPVGRLVPVTNAAAGEAWCVGCETVDRGYVDFEAMKPYLAQVGCGQVRLQGGWARCEPAADGVYDWAWLDACVFGCAEVDIRPWLQLSYGNPSYEGGGGIGLAQEYPTSPEALAAFEAWTRAAVRRYGPLVHAWEVWNEPDQRGCRDTGEGYGRLLVRVARAVTEEDPNARIYAMSMAGPGAEFTAEALEVVRQAGASDLITAALFHGYPPNPDEGFGRWQRWARVMREYLPDAQLVQGETGAPAERNDFMALRDIDWTPRMQASWFVRRMLAHHARGFAMNVFQISDMNYAKRDGAVFKGRNTKGLVACRDDSTAEATRPAYFAVRNVFTLFGRDVALGAERVACDEDVVAYAWGEGTSAWWMREWLPTQVYPGLLTVRADVPVPRDPVLVDVFGGVAYALPEGMGTSWPCTDRPFVLADRGRLHLTEFTQKP